MFTPGRLKLGEDVLVGVGSKGRLVFGSLSAAHAFVAPPPGARELGFEEDLFGTVRVLEQLQLGVSVPFVQTSRAVPGLAELGGGVGDISASARYELVSPNTSQTWPGIALLAGFSAATGTAPESALTPLGAGATGVGASQLSLGLDLERAFGRVLLDVSALGSQRLARTVLGVHEQLPVQAAGFSVAYVVYGETAVAAYASASVEGDAWVNGARVPASGRALFDARTVGGDSDWKGVPPARSGLRRPSLARR